MANVLDCDIAVNEFNIQSRYLEHFQTDTFRKGITPLSPLPIIGKILPQLFFFKEDFTIKLALKFDIKLNKETETNIACLFVCLLF